MAYHLRRESSGAAARHKQSGGHNASTDLWERLNPFGTGSWKDSARKVTLSSLISEARLTHSGRNAYPSLSKCLPLTSPSRLLCFAPARYAAASCRPWQTLRCRLLLT